MVRDRWCGLGTRAVPNHDHLCNFHPRFGLGTTVLTVLIFALSALLYYFTRHR